jgi:hypothetical protein
MIGLLLGRVIHENYRDDATQKIVQTAMGTISLVAALVLGLLVATAKNKFDTDNQQTEQFAANLMLLNRELANFGPGANESKGLLRKYTIAKIAATWPKESGPKPGPNDPPPWELLESFQKSVIGLIPQTESQRSEVTTALQTTADLTKTTWLETAKEADHIQHPFVFVMLGWLFLLFVGYGLYAPRNLLVVAALFVGALSIAGAIVLIVDMDSPFEGLIVVSPEPMQKALATMISP